MSALTPKPAIASQGILYRLTRNKVGVAGFVVVGFIVFIAVFGPFMARDIKQDAQNTWSGPTSQHWLGTDHAGKDVFDQLLAGGGTIVYVGFLAAAISTTIAVIFGALAAYLRGRTDRILLQATDIVMTVPQIVLLAVMGAFFQLTSPTVVAILIGCLSWPILMRSIRAQVLTLKEREFVEAAKLLDLGTTRIVFSEIVPNMAGFVIINFIIAVTDAVYALVGLYVLGLAPLAGHNWGIMINKAWVLDAFSLPEGVTYMMGPVALIALLQLGLIMLTRSLEEVFNPRLSEG